jgi:hypothetical protein
MKSQQTFSLDSPNQMPTPDGNRPDPVFWVREIAVRRNLEDGEQNEVRRIKLRRGLNVLWAKPESESGPVRLYEPGLSGHASGKTTFCRILRHVLGERHFANELVTRGVREKFEGGWILGEVFINSDLWLVGRPFTLGARPFCVRGITINEYLTDKPSSESLPVFLDELEKATIKSLSVKVLPKSGEPVQWPHLLEWLSRDQECRFIQITDWRSKLSRSEAPDIPVEDQHSLMRSVVGVLSEEERNEIENNAKLIRQKEAATNQVPILESQAKTDHQRLERSFGRTLPTPDDPLLVQTVRTELDQSLKQTESAIQNIDKDADLSRLEDEYNVALTRMTETATEIRVVGESIERLKTKLQLHQRDKSKQSAQDFAAKLPPGAGYCRVPIEEAKQKGCTLAFDQPRDLVSDGVLKSLVDKGPEIQREIDSLRQRQDVLKQELTDRKQQEQSSQKALMQRRTSLTKERTVLYNQRSEILDRIKLAERAREAFEKSSQLKTRIEDLDRQILTSREQQEQLRQRTKKAVADLSSLYEEVVRAVLGNSVSGAIQLSGRDFVCKIERNGDVSSGAIDTIKILAFDLAAMAASVSGQGDHPRFLLHDSPREADMAPLTYKRLFLWARKLEESFNGKDCNFQYIITTTEPPPEELQASPWLLDPILDASQPEKRLLGVDL